MLADAIASLGAHSFTVTRRTGGGYDAYGRAISPTTTTAPLEGMMQPLTGAEIDRLPEGLRARELRAFWTTGALVVADSEASTSGDHIADAAGLQWEVVVAEDWASIGGYNRYTVSRVSQ